MSLMDSRSILEERVEKESRMPHNVSQMDSILYET